MSPPISQTASDFSFHVLNWDAADLFEAFAQIAFKLVRHCRTNFLQVVANREHETGAPTMSTELIFHKELLTDIKTRVRLAQRKAALSANAEMTLMYWDIGRMIAARQELEGWGAGVISRLAIDLKNELPEEKGFSSRNIGRMIAFFRAYPILPRAVAKLDPFSTTVLEDANSGSSAILPPPVAKLEARSATHREAESASPARIL